jgi:dolichol-phosphate mannosyltransferase
MKTNQSPTIPPARLLIAVATYNEMENLPTLVDEVFRYAPHAHLLIVDDNSPDGTGRWCDERAARDARVRCLHRPGKMGLGTATIAALRYAVDCRYPYVINMDADFSHAPEMIPELLAGMDRDGQPHVDVMIGSRYIQGGAIRGWPWWRHLASRAVNVYARLLLGLRPRDCSGSFRCYRTALLQRLRFDTFYARGYAVLEELLWQLKMTGARFDETAIVFVNRTKGESKIHWREAVSALGIILRLGIKNWLGQRRQDR